MSIEYLVVFFEYKIYNIYLFGVFFQDFRYSQFGDRGFVVFFFYNCRKIDYREFTGGFFSGRGSYFEFRDFLYFFYIYRVGKVFFINFFLRLCVFV